MNEYLNTFFACFKEFSNGLESTNTKFISIILKKNELFEGSIKRSRTDLEQFVYVSLYFDSFFKTFVSTLDKVGFNMKPLLNKRLKVLAPFRMLRDKKLLRYEVNDSAQQIIASNHLLTDSFKVDKTFFTEADLHSIYDFFEFMELVVRYTEAFEHNDKDLRKIVEPKLLQNLKSILL